MTSLQLIYNINGSTYYWRDQNTHKIPMALFVENRKRLCYHLNCLLPETKDVWIFLQGGQSRAHYNTDIPADIFRQESFFQWTFGVLLPNCVGLIDVATCDAYLFISDVQNQDPKNVYEVFDHVRSLDVYKYCYKMKEVYRMEDLDDFLNKQSRTLTLLTLGAVNDSESMLGLLKMYDCQSHTYDNNLLYNLICHLRSIKTSYEIAVIRYVTQVTSRAHKLLMKRVRPNMMQYQLEAIFRGYVYREGGCRTMAHMPNCRSGSSIAYLYREYELAPNEKISQGLCLLSMGARYFGYNSNICCTIPGNGRFKDYQKLFYNVVLKCREFLLNVLKPHQNMVDIQMQTNDVLLDELINLGLLRGTVPEMNKIDLVKYFLPHGIAHFIGLDYHDVGATQLPDCPRCPNVSNLKNLLAQCILEVGMTLVITPACYFNAHIFQSLRENEDTITFLDQSVMINFIKCEGVRLEDVVLITSDGCEVLSDVPRTVDEIENFMAGN